MNGTVQPPGTEETMRHETSAQARCALALSAPLRRTETATCISESAPPEAQKQKARRTRRFPVDFLLPIGVIRGFCGFCGFGSPRPRRGRKTKVTHVEL